MRFIAVFLLVAMAGCGAGVQLVGNTQGYGAVARALRSQNSMFARKGGQVVRLDLSGLKWNLRRDVKKSIAYYNKRMSQLNDVQKEIVRDKFDFSGEVIFTDKEQKLAGLAMGMHKYAAELAIMTDDLDTAKRIMKRIIRVSESVGHVQLQVHIRNMYKDGTDEILLTRRNVDRIARNLYTRHASFGKGS